MEIKTDLHSVFVRWRALFTAVHSRSRRPHTAGCLEGRPGCREARSLLSSSNFFPKRSAENQTCLTFDLIQRFLVNTTLYDRLPPPEVE